MNRAVSGTVGASLWDAQDLPAAKQIENSNNLSSFTIPPAAYRPGPPSSCGHMIVSGQETGKPAEKAELPETSLGAYPGPQPFTKPVCKVGFYTGIGQPLGAPFRKHTQ